MGTKVLGRITGTFDRPRGPDAQLSVSIPEDWISCGATLEIALPRNLTCAACHGGGCDRCERSGAVSLRSRKAPGESVEVTLPRSLQPEEQGTSVAPGAKRSVVVRIPERGGAADRTPELPRGNLLVSIRPGAEPSKGVTRLKRPSVPAPPVVPEILEGVAPLPESKPPAKSATASPVLYVAIVVLVALVVAWLLRR